jgi:hypothetical protein
MRKKNLLPTLFKHKKERKYTISKSINQKRNKGIFIQDMRDDIECNKKDSW